MLVALLALVVGTWNGNWFPSGRAEHRAHPDVEAATIEAAGQMLAKGIAAADPSGTEDVVVVLNEIRNREVAERLVGKIGRPGLKVASISAYRRRDRFDQQQDVVLTTLPTAEAGWGRWQRSRETAPPRGYAYADVVVSPAVTARVYAVHLKSNYGATTEEKRADNRAKRASAVEQLVSIAKGCKAVVVAGDFNADKWRGEFSGDTIFSTLEAAGYSNLVALMPASGRGTHPNRKYGDSALDYIMVKGLDAVGVPKLVPNESLSDHFALFAQVRVPRQVSSKEPSSAPRSRRNSRRPAAPRGRRQEPLRTP